MNSNDKKSLRKLWKAVPAPVNHVRLSEKILAFLVLQKDLQSAKNIGLYSPFVWEPNLIGLWTKFPDRVAFPKIEKVEEGIKFHKIASLSALQPGYHQIPEPPANSPLVNWEMGDVLLIPGICFDRSGIRLGSGKGYYDRFLARCGTQLKIWGVSFESRIIAEALPRESHDIPMDRLVTESGFLSKGSGA